MTSYLRKPGSLFWVISGLALVWNLIGVINYLGQVLITDEILKSLPKEQQLMYQDVPSWVTAAFAVAVFSGTLGAVFKEKSLFNFLYIIICWNYYTDDIRTFNK
jgi:hypothetical protein